MTVATPDAPQSAVPAAALPHPRPRHPWLALVLLLAMVCAWILSLPLFPTQDGPVHLYYARVTLDLLHGGSPYATEYRIARLFPPYSVHAYVLMGLLRSGLSPSLSEKLLACLSVLLGGFGFWYFARQIGPAADVVALFAVPLLLNRYLFFGLYAYWIGIAIGFFAMGVWLRQDRGTPARRACFVGLTILCLFGHPVPFLLLLGFCWTEVAAGWWSRSGLAARRSDGHVSQTGFVSPSWGDVATLAGVSLLLVYVKMYSDSGALWQSYSWFQLRQNLQRVLHVFNGSLLAPLTWQVYAYALGAILVGATVAACGQALRESRSGRFTRAQLVLAWAILFLVALPLLPEDVNGGFLFADRITIWLALMFVAAAAAVDGEVVARLARGLTALGVVLSVSLLVALNGQLRPVARELSVPSFPHLAPGEHLYAINLTPNPQFTYNPYLWTGARVVEAEGGILVNSPWLLTSIMMLQHESPTAVVAGRTFYQPYHTSRLVSAGAVLTDCGNLRLRASIGMQMLAEARGQLALWRTPCYELLLPTR